MNKINNLIILSTVICLLSCNKQDNKISTEYSSSISFDINKANKICNFSDICKNVTFIELETKDESIIGNIDKLHIANNNIYIKDGNKLNVFGINGTFLFCLNKRGAAPNEYIEISDFSITDNGEIVISDALSKKIIFYNNKGNYITHKIFNFYIEDIAVLNDSLYIIDCNDNKNEQLVIWNKNIDKIIYKYFEYENRFILPLQQTFCNIDKKIYYQIPLSNELYSFNKNGKINQKISLDFNDYNIKESDIVNVDLFGGEIPVDKGQNVSIKTIYDNSRFYCIHYICERINKDAYYLHFLSKNTTREFILNSENFNDDVLFYDYAILPLMSTVYDDKFIGIVYPYIWKDCINEINDSRCDTKQFNTIKAFVDKLSDEQNPILVVYDI